MKKLVMLIMMLLIFCNHLYAEDRKNVYYMEIKKIHFFANKTLGAINSYVIFYDKNGNPCSTNGYIRLYRKRKAYVRKTVVPKNAMSSKQIVVLVEKKIFIKKITFKPDNFEYLKLVRGDTVFALPITLDSSEVQSGDILVLEWCTFTVEEKIF
ncbi:MAG: hypothetical protein ABID83_06050 [Candidatus Omnitrophota bacterium]